MGKHDKIKTDKKENTNKKSIGFKIFILGLIVFAILGFIFAKNLYDLKGNWVAALMGHNKNTLENLEPLQILILGESTGLSDTMIVCSYNPKVQQASMLSIPRDTFAGSSITNATYSDKLNALFSGGKTPEKTLEAINKITGLDIKNYILIDTEALTKLVNTIDGIEFNVPIDMDYDDDTQNLHVHFKAGLQKLNGEQVEELVRFRHNNDGSTYSFEYGIEDYGRMHTQRDLIIATAKQTIQFKNLTEIGNIIDILKDHVKTNMNLMELKDYAPYALNMNMENVKNEQLPGESKLLNEIWFFLHDEKETEALVTRLFSSHTN